MKVKLLSAWFGPRPDWWAKYVAQMRRFALVDWECFPDDSVPLGQQTKWMNALMSNALGLDCKKGENYGDDYAWDGVQAMCDFRPAYGEVFADRYAGYNWWGWADLDLLFGDLDGLLPALLTDDVDCVNFKPKYLSGCLALFRNVPKATNLFRKSARWQDVMADARYHCWDESGYKHYGLEESFWTLVKGNLRVRQADALYGYQTKNEPHPVELRRGKLYDVTTGEERLFCHFMHDRWPISADGSARGRARRT